MAGSPSLEETQGTAFISDGAEWPSELQQCHFPLATPIVDFYHASEYIWHGHKMDYPKYESLGDHTGSASATDGIGSGVIEGACKNVIQSHMKRSGMRWSRPGAENLLKLRVTYLNDEWNQVALCQRN